MSVDLCLERGVADLVGTGSAGEARTQIAGWVEATQQTLRGRPRSPELDRREGAEQVLQPAQSLALAAKQSAEQVFEAETAFAASQEVAERGRRPTWAAASSSSRSAILSSASSRSDLAASSCSLSWDIRTAATTAHPPSMSTRRPRTTVTTMAEFGQREVDGDCMIGKGIGRRIYR